MDWKFQKPLKDATPQVGYLLEGAEKDQDFPVESSMNNNQVRNGKVKTTADSSKR